MAPIQSDITTLPEGKTNDALKPCMNTEECKRKSEVNKDKNSLENESQVTKQPCREFAFPVTSPFIAEDEMSHQVTIDMQDFKDGDVKVKVVDDKEVVVEGNIEKQQEGSVSKKSFYRRFSFPGLDSEQNVSASMSADGILTINMPKSGALSKEENTVSSNHSDKNSITQHDITAQDKKEVKVERIVKSSEENVSKKQNDLEETVDEKMTEDNPDGFHCLLPICERGLFFHDCFFEDIQKEFEEAVDQMLDVFGEDEATNDNEASDTNTEINNIVKETGGMTLSEDEKSYKYVLDVRGYPLENVRVRVEDEEVVVEGSVEKEEDSLRSSKSFCRRFNFPYEVDLKALTSAVSPDGMLTITAPKAIETNVKKDEAQ